MTPFATAHPKAHMIVNPSVGHDRAGVPVTMPRALVEDLARLIPGRVFHRALGRDELIHLHPTHQRRTEVDGGVPLWIDRGAPAGEAVVDEVTKVGLGVPGFRGHDAVRGSDPVTDEVPVFLQRRRQRGLPGLRGGRPAVRCRQERNGHPASFIGPVIELDVLARSDDLVFDPQPAVLRESGAAHGDLNRFAGLGLRR